MTKKYDVTGHAHLVSDLFSDGKGTIILIFRGDTGLGDGAYVRSDNWGSSWSSYTTFTIDSDTFLGPASYDQVENEIYLVLFIHHLTTSEPVINSTSELSKTLSFPISNPLIILVKSSNRIV